MSTFGRIRNRPRLWVSAALITAGLGSGAVLGSTLTAGAATTTSTAATVTSSGSSSSSPALTPSSSPSSSSGAAAPPPGRPPAGGPSALTDSGTVTAVGSSTVTIDGKVYAVTSASDIDKNGEASLSDLAVGDKVTFSTETSATTPTIDKLHAGNEALDRPSGPPPGQSGASPTGAAPAAGSVPAAG